MGNHLIATMKLERCGPVHTWWNGIMTAPTKRSFETKRFFEDNKGQVGIPPIEVVVFS